MNEVLSMGGRKVTVLTAVLLFGALIGSAAGVGLSTGVVRAGMNGDGSACVSAQVRCVCRAGAGSVGAALCLASGENWCVPVVEEGSSAMKEISRRGDALQAVANVAARLEALQPFLSYGPNFRPRVADELARAHRAWHIEAAGSFLVTAEIAAGLRPEADYRDRCAPEVFDRSPQVLAAVV
ncbi:hypothetical protein BO226_25190 (plasmid) [Rhodococcus sp. 2G]|nr:hypothetical protein BO226_25190 [Rhodococcus sp. 2G]